MKPERERQILYGITYMWNLKYGTNEQIYETKTYLQRTELWLPGEGAVGKGRMGSLELADASYNI